MQPPSTDTTPSAGKPPPGSPVHAPATPAPVTSLPTTPPLESPAFRPLRVASPINRWEISPRADSVGSSTSERLGDHAAQRYRHFRWFVELQHGENLDNVLFSMLLSSEGLCDEIRAFEEASPLVRLAQTGFLVQKLRQLHELLDSVALTFAKSEPEDLKTWETRLDMERTQRCEKFDLLLKVRLGDVGEGSTGVELDYDDLDDWDMTNETLVEEVLTMLAAGVDKYADDILIQQETQTITEAFEVVSRHSNIVALTIPMWFVSSIEFGGTYGLGRWGNNLLYPDHNDRERFIMEASVWSRLNHPHIAKFLGACHVGSRPFFAHEKVRTMTEYLSAVTDRQAVWCRLYELALGVRYLHERGFGCRQLCLKTVYCARFEDKTLLLGVDLAKSGTEPTDPEPEPRLRTNSLAKLIRADIQSLFFCILDTLSVLASSQNEKGRILDDNIKKMNVVSSRALPTSRPEFVKEDEWSVMQPLFMSDSELNMLVVLDRLSGLAGNEERDVFDSMVSIDKQLDKQVIDLGAIRVQSNGMPLSEVLEHCERLVAREPSCAQIYARLSNVMDEVHQRDLGGMDSNEVKDMLGHVCGLIVRYYRFLYQKSTSAASSLAGWNRREPAALFSFHTGIDHWIKHYGKSNELNPIHDWQSAWHQLQSSRKSLQIQSQSAVVVNSNDDEGEMYCEFEWMHHPTAYLKESNASSDSAHTGSQELPIDVPKQSSLPKWLIPPYEVDFSEFDAFGGGSFGTVHRGRWFETPVVVKRVSTNGEDKRVIQQQFRREADIWFGLNHINVIKMYGACHVGQPFFVCEYASGGDLTEYLERAGREPYLIWYCLLNAALGLQYLHDAGVVHGDLKADNILVGADRNVKLADFGLSLSTSTRSSQGASGGAVGAYRWKAPECIPYKDDPGQSPTFASDVYSFAMCIIEVVSGEFPWGLLIPEAAVILQVKRGQLPKRPNNMEDTEWKLIERMCCFDPSKRVTIGAVVAHLSALLQHKDMEQLWPSINGDAPLKSYKNRVISRDGALLSLLKLAASSNVRLAGLACDHLLAVQINRDTQAGIREFELIVNMLTNESIDIQTWAARAIRYLCWDNDDNRMSIVAFGALPILVGFIRVGNEDQKAEATGALQNLAINDVNSVAIAVAGAIPDLVAMIFDGSEFQKTNAAAALQNLATNDENRVAIAAVGGIPALVTLLRNGNEIQKKHAAGALHNLSMTADNSVAIVEAGAIPALVALIRDGNEGQKTNSADALQNLATIDENGVIIAAAGAIPALVALTLNGNEIQKNHAAGALHSLSSNADHRVVIAASGGIPALVSLICDGNEDQKTSGTGALAFLSEIDDNRVAIATAGAIPALVALIRDGNEVQKTHSAGALAYLAVNEDNKMAIAASGGIPALVALVLNDNDLQKTCAAVALHSLSAINDNKVAIAVAGGVPALVALVHDGNEIQKEFAAAALHSLSSHAEFWVAVTAAGITLPW